MDDQMKKPAVFLDRDGTINEQMGYINHPSRFFLLPGTADAIRLLNANGFLAIVVSNQSGVARGYFPVELVHEIHAKMEEMLEKGRARLDGSQGHCSGIQCEMQLPEAGNRAHRAGLPEIGNRYGAIVRCRRPVPGPGNGSQCKPEGSACPHRVWPRRKGIPASRFLGKTGACGKRSIGGGPMDYQLQKE